jgi:acyl dehydratase
MPLNIDNLRQWTFPPIETVLDDRDVMFYALSIGLGRDALDEHDLRFVYEKDLKVFPTMPLVVGHPGHWMADPATGITRTMVVHGAQRLWTYAELPIGQPLVTTNKLTDILDKGEKGAVIIILRETFDKQSGTLLARGESHVFCRADGGFGGASGPANEFPALPERAPDLSVDIPTASNMALFYRLNNDRNPLHAEPAYAKKAGFSRPILHGLATFGVAAVAIAKAFPDKRLSFIETRFSKPVLPGETVTIDLWNEPEDLAFRARIVARDAIVLDRGKANLV